MAVMLHGTEATKKVPNANRDYNGVNIISIPQSNINFKLEASY